MGVWVRKMNGFSKEKKRKNLNNTDNNMVITRIKRVGEVEEQKGKINGDGRCD